MAAVGIANDAAFEYFSCQSTTVLCLKERGISINGRRKRDMVKLCVWAHQENLDLKTGDADFSFKKDHDDRLLVGVRQLLDPLSLSNWVCDLSQCPIVHTTDICIYLREKCGYTPQRLRRYQEDDGANLNRAGHVHDVMVHKVEYTSEESYCFVKGKCTPETRLSASPYDMWILIDKNGVMYSAECTCPAGDGSCKHVVAMLLGLEEILKEKGPTEAPMTWHKRKQVGCVPQEVKHLNFKPEAKTSQPHYTYFNPGMRNSTKELEDMFVSMVLESGENCIGLTSFDKEDIAGDVNNYTLPKNIVEMCTLYKLSTKTYSFDEFITFLKVNITNDDCNVITEKNNWTE